MLDGEADRVALTPKAISTTRTPRPTQIAARPPHVATPVWASSRWMSARALLGAGARVRGQRVGGEAGLVEEALQLADRSGIDVEEVQEPDHELRRGLGRPPADVGPRGRLLEEHPALDDPVAQVGPGERLALSLVVPLDRPPGPPHVRQRLERAGRAPPGLGGCGRTRGAASGRAAAARQPPARNAARSCSPARRAIRHRPASRAPWCSVRGGSPRVRRTGGRLDLHRLESPSRPPAVADDSRGSGRGSPDQQEGDPQRRHGDGDGAAQARGHPVTVPTVVAHRS